MPSRVEGSDVTPPIRFLCQWGQIHLLSSRILPNRF